MDSSIQHKNTQFKFGRVKHDVTCLSNSVEVSLGGLGVTCSPRDPRFADSNPAEVDGFFQDVKILSTVLREGL